MKRIVKGAALVGAVIMGLGYSSTLAQAASKVSQNSDSKYSKNDDSNTREGISLKKLYASGVLSQNINSEATPYAEWESLENSFLWPNYVEIKREGILAKDINYQKWLKDNNYGVIADKDPNLEVVEQNQPTFGIASTADNKRNFVNRIRKGDFVVVSNTREPWANYIGHAAIATSNNYMLDMPGYKDGQYSKSNNNRQLNKGTWFNKYQKAWTTVYRVKTSSNVRNQIASWADWRYWSSTHGLKKNRRVAYKLATKLKGDYGNAYCSKLVWQALYYGSGNVALVQPRPTTFIVAPYFLPNEVMSKYYPTKYGPY